MVCLFYQNKESLVKIYNLASRSADQVTGAVHCVLIFVASASKLSFQYTKICFKKFLYCFLELITPHDLGHTAYLVEQTTSLRQPAVNIT